MKVILFGTGEYYQRYKVWFETEEICALVDNAEYKWGTHIDGVIVIPAEKISNYEYDAIFVLTFDINNISAQLINVGVEKEKIHTFYEINDLIYANSKKKKINKYYPGITGGYKKEIVLMNSDLVLGGPALALFNMAKVLKEYGYSVTYASMVDGPLRQVVLDAGIFVIVDANLLAETMYDCEWVKDYSLIICNTINYHVFLSKRDESIPVFWWLHDPAYFYQVVNHKAIDRINSKNLFIASVGPIARKAMSEFRPDFIIGDLIYGVQEFEQIKVKPMEEIKVFSIIGFVEPHKGQDILIDAIKLLPKEIRKTCRFKFVGKNVSLYAKECMTKSSDIKEIEFLGQLDRKEIHELLEKTDVLVCPSRQDCMPTVCAEAMMHYIPCIVSDVTGTAAYIADNNGFVFESENESELAKKIMKVIDSKENFDEIKKSARNLFDKIFSMKTFEVRIEEYISKLL